MIVVAHICAQAFNILRDVCLDLAVTNVREAVAVAVSDVVVFKAGLLDGLEEVDSLSNETC